MCDLDLFEIDYKRKVTQSLVISRLLNLEPLQLIKKASRDIRGDMKENVKCTITIYIKMFQVFENYN